MPQATVLGVYETSWREAGTLHRLWTAVIRLFAFYRGDRHRSRAAMAALLGADETEAGEPPPDRYSPPIATVLRGHLPLERRSLCRAHLASDFRAAPDRGGIDAVVGRWVLELLGRILVPWRQQRQGALTRKQLLTAVATHQEELLTPLRWGSERGMRTTRALCNDLSARWESLWTWLPVDGGEPTNNAAKRALRGLVAEEQRRASI